LYGNEAHPTAEAVHRVASAQMPAISLKTVYQTLNDLAAMGELSMLDVGTGSARFDPNIETSHHHLVCERCGKVRDLHASFGDLVVPDAQRQGFTIGTAEIVFRGVCDSCTNPPDHKE
jgi:Fe2+ or Zn2+ uptake regulation protein